MTWPLLNNWLKKENYICTVQLWYQWANLNFLFIQRSVTTGLNDSVWHCSLMFLFLTIRIDTKVPMQWLLFSYVLLLFLFSWSPADGSFESRFTCLFPTGRHRNLHLRKESFGFISYFKERALTNPYIGNRDFHWRFLTLNCIPEQWKHLFHLTSYCVLMGLALKHLKLVILLSLAEWRGGS